MGYRTIAAKASSLDSAPLIVSLVQVATSLPACLFALPAGALADTLDRRRLIMTAEIASAAIAAFMAALVALELATAGALLVCTFLLGATAALTAPAWQAIVPQLVPRHTLPQAVAANSGGIDISRPVGPR
jgi:MFS family permease